MSAAEFNAKQRAKRLATCRHFTGIMNEKCAAGVTYRDVRDTSGPGMAKWPCLGGECAKSCDKRAPTTEAEVRAEEVEMARRFGAIFEARAAIISTKKKSGTVACVLCKAPDALHFTVSSYNGHVHASCSTKGCLSWME